MNVPILMLTYNRLSYTKLALEALTKCRGADIYVIDNGSTDGTKKWLFQQHYNYGWKLKFNAINIGIAGGMNQFLYLTQNFKIVSKVDNDTLVQPDFIEKMLPHMERADIVQARHPLIPASGVGTFDQWVSKMPGDGALRFNSFCGGSGVLFKRQLVDRIPETENKLMGWRQWQREHPEVKKAFALDCEITLLDTSETGVDYSKYPEYYAATGRVQINDLTTTNKEIKNIGYKPKTNYNP